MSAERKRDHHCIGAGCVYCLRLREAKPVDEERELDDLLGTHDQAAYAGKGIARKNIESAVRRSARKQDYINGVNPNLGLASEHPGYGSKQGPRLAELKREAAERGEPAYTTSQNSANQPSDGGDGVGPGRLATPAAALAFLLAGNATFTIRSKRTQTRYTYKVRRAENKLVTEQQAKFGALPRQYPNTPVWFVSLLAGPDNEGDYTYLGMIKDRVFRLTGKSRMKMDSVPVVAFAWMFDKLAKRTMPKDAEIWHEGRCGRCGRKLTVPESIAAGIGPDCASKMEGF